MRYATLSWALEVHYHGSGTGGGGKSANGAVHVAAGDYDRWQSNLEAILSLTTSSSSFLPSIQSPQGSTGRNVSDTMAPLSINGHHWVADYITRYAALNSCSRLPLGLAGATYSAWQCENRAVILADCKKLLLAESHRTSLG